MKLRSFIAFWLQLTLLSTTGTQFFCNAFNTFVIRFPSSGRSPVVEVVPTRPQQKRQTTTKRMALHDQPENDFRELEPKIVASRAPTSSNQSTTPLLFSLLLVSSGGLLGPFLDSYHSSFGVLQYDSPIEAILWGKDAAHPALITAWWVPELFGLAGLIIGWLYISLDAVLASPDAARKPSPPKILVGIAIFTFQYWLSGVLFQSQVDRTAILNVMSVVAATGFALLDGTVAGFLSSVATAFGGPLIEVGLLSLAKADLMLDSGYHYMDPGETGYFPLWIAPVYFLGGPAVGNLARGYWSFASAPTSKRSRSLPGCKVCSDTRQVPCPNCDGIGTYVAMGGRSVTCTSCQGRGFVICRSCFSQYNEDPNDTEAIRELMRGRPD